MTDNDRLKIGPKSGVTYPIQVIYCGNCTMPIEVSLTLFFLHIIITSIN